MSKNMLIDSAHMEEIRVAVVDGEKLDKFDFEIPSKAQIKGNIYLAKVVRVEPSLQAAFVDYGGERHGFLSFSEIHCDYFQIPVDDRRDLKNHIQNAVSALLAETSTEELDPKEIARLRYQFYRRYKIQEVIKKRQIMLAQVVKEERGNKGAALTTYISLAGRYCVLMPNTAKGSGVSRKIADYSDRAKLRKIVSDLHIENGSTVIRTAGAEHSKMEITKDFNFLKKMWDEIRETTMKSTAPCLIHEEANIIKRAIRDLYSRDVESIFVEGEEGYKIAKSFAKKLMPGQAKKVKLYEDKKLPLFAKFKINDQINQIYCTRVDLPSGGYLIINTTEALISIDVNSGKATRERNISETALKTNLEAAVEIARQCRLRDLAGLIVVDFIDMGERRNNSQVEKCLRDTLREDRAKIQIGAISNFGLLEFSRQRLRSSIADANMAVCSHCNGIGFVWSNESIAIQVLRKIEETFAVLNFQEVAVTLSTDVALYLMNNKRSFISELEKRTNSKIFFKIDNSIAVSDFKIEQMMHPISQNEPLSATRQHVRDSKMEDGLNENNSISNELLENKEEDRPDDAPESSKEVVSSSSRDKKNRSMRRNRRFRKKKQNDDAELAENSSTAEVTIDASASESKSSLSEKTATENVVKFIENHNKIQEAVFNLQSSEKKKTAGLNKKEKAGWWQRLLQKSIKERSNG